MYIPGTWTLNKDVFAGNLANGGGGGEGGG